MEMSMAFSNLLQATAENCATINNLKTVNSTLTEQVAMYANSLSTKEADNVSLKTAMNNLHGEVNLQGEVKNLKA